MLAFAYRGIECHLYHLWFLFQLSITCPDLIVLTSTCTNMAAEYNGKYHNHKFWGIFHKNFWIHHIIPQYHFAHMGL